MANTSEVTYLGELRTEAVHLQSGNKIGTDAPRDNHGKGEAFSPTDLLATSLACCALTTIGVLAQRDNLPIDVSGTKAEVIKIMATEPRRVSEIHLKITFKKAYTEKEKKIIEHTFHTCPVAKSLHPDIRQVIEFVYL
ncbi:MAG TPA: OsmC family protein [Bacteroidia bacterium]|jgi:putative redox protein|nr:OsmC family protein [Bacteroidia bacterium]